MSEDIRVHLLGQELQAALAVMADIVGNEYTVTFIARNKLRPHADITLTTDKDERIQAFIKSMDVTDGSNEAKGEQIG